MPRILERRTKSIKNTDCERIKMLFGRFSGDYNKHMRTTNHVRVQLSILDDFLAWLKHNRQGKLKALDIATGTGTIAKRIMHKTNSEVHGIDYCPEMIKEAQKSHGINFSVGNVLKLPYKKHSFDVVTCSYGFYWFGNIERAINEIRKVLKPGSYFVLLEEEFKKGNPKPRFSKYKQPYLKELANSENYIGIKMLKQKISKAGFKLIREIRMPVDNVHGTVGMMFRIQT